MLCMQTLTPFSIITKNPEGVSTGGLLFQLRGSGSSVHPLGVQKTRT